MWNDLTMQQRADVISMAVKAGMRDMKSIRSFYDEALGSRRFDDGGDIEEERPPMVPFSQREEVIITPDQEYNKYLNTLPDNQRFTPNEEYDSYLYWQLHGKPKDFKEAYDRGMFNYDYSDNGYHGNSIAYDDNGIGYFIKPKTHDTVKYELDWYNKSLVTEEGGHQRPMNKEEQAFHDDFKSKYDLINDPDRPNYYRYQPKEKAFGGHLFDGESEPVNALYKPEENVVHRVTRVNGDSVGMDPDTGKFYDNITGNYIGDHVALDEVVVTPKKSTIVDTIRERLRKGINPASSYDNPIGRVLNAVILGGTDYSADRDPYADAAWDKYLGFANNKITESKYKPTKGDSNQKYYTYDDLILSSYVDPVLGKNYTEDSNREFINEALNLKVGDTALGNQPPVLNDFTYSHGHDRKGDYISVYDKYDINPFKDIINTGDLSLGVGKPFELYDRLYLDDHYGVEGKYKGASYLPEVKIESYRRQPKAKTISN